MLQKWLVLVGLVFVGVLAGCNKDTAADREEFAGVMTTEDGKTLIPVNLPERKGDAILGAIAASAEPAKAEGAKAGGEGEATEEVKVDDSSAEAVANSLVAIVKAGDFAKLSDVVPADQTEQMKEYVKAYEPIAKASRQLKLVLDEKFPDNDVPGTFPISQTLGSMVAAELKVEVKSVNDTEAVAAFVAGPEATAKKIELTIKKFDQTWRVVLPDFAPPPDIAAAAKLDEGKDMAFADIAKRIESGDLKDVDSVKAQLTEVAAGTYKPAAPAEGASESGEKAKGEKAKPEKAEKSAKKPRERDEVDGVYSGPGMLRGG